MKEMEPADRHVFLAALGWLELKNCAEAKVELGKLGLSLEENPDVLELKFMIHSEEADWASALEAARALVKAAPERASGWLHQAYALRRVTGGGLQSAWEALLPVADRFPEEPIVPYNLSCYSCQMDRMDDARQWLRRAMSCGSKADIKKLAMGDEDLKPIWGEIKRW